MKNEIACQWDNNQYPGIYIEPEIIHHVNALDN